MVDIIELRGRRGLLGVIVGGTALVFRHGQERYEFDLLATLTYGEPVMIERVLHPPEKENETRENPVEQ